MREVIKKPAFWLLLLGIIAVIWLGYRYWQYSKCQDVKGATCPNPGIKVTEKNRVFCNFWKGKICRALTPNEIINLANLGKG